MRDFLQTPHFQRENRQELPYHLEPYTIPLQAHLFQQINPYKLSRLVTKHVKNYLRRKLNFEARAFLLARFSNVKWHFVASPQLFDLLHSTPPQTYPSSFPPRYSALGYRLGPRCPFPLTASSHPPHPLPLRLWTFVLSLSRGSFSWLGEFEPPFC